MSTQKTIDRRILRTRRAIVQAFNELMNEKGLDAVTVMDIAERAMINRATFYAHFSDKYELFGYLIRESFLEYLQEELSEFAPFDEAHLRRLATAVFHYMRRLNSRCHKPPRAKFSPIVEAQVQTQLYEYVLAWLNQSPTTPISTQPELAASMISWSMFGTGLQWSQEKSTIAVEAVIDGVMALLCQGILLTSEQSPAQP